MRFQLKHTVTGKRIVIDNENKENGKIKFFGDVELVELFDKWLNTDTDIKYNDMIPSLQKILPAGCIIETPYGRQVYTASDLYLKEYFIPKVIKLHGYELAIEEFKG